jgi:hypothetical protein
VSYDIGKVVCAKNWLGSAIIGSPLFEKPLMFYPLSLLSFAVIQPAVKFLSFEMQYTTVSSSSFQPISS